MKKSLFAVAALMIVLAACSPVDLTIAPTETPTALPITPQFFATATPTPVPDPIYLNILWEYHQPLYTTDSQTGLVTRPWARVRATEYYYEMAAMLKKYPKVHASFSFSPVLVRQLEDMLSGARDIYWELSTRQTSSLSEEDKRFVLMRFFDTDASINIASYPRYKELLDKRGSSDDAQINNALQSFTEQDIRDLQVWFNLATFDADLLTQSPLKDMVAKGRDYSEDDKRVILEQLLDTLRSLFPLYAEMQANGQVEMATTSYARAILPLVSDTNVARTSTPSASLPDPAFSFPQDTHEQLRRAAEGYQQLFNRAPRGLLPSEGAVASDLVQAASEADYQWMVSGESVLAKSLQTELQAESFTRDGNVLQEADVLYRPYYAQGQDGSRISIAFRDDELSALIESRSDDIAPEKAAQDIIDRILAIKAQLKKTNATGPHLVTLVVDAERAWTNHANDGKQFVTTLYERLSDAADRFDIQTTTLSNYLATYPDQRTLDTLWPGTWTTKNQADFSAWIGSPEQNNAWSYLYRTRQFLEAYLTEVNTADPAALAKAYDAMLLAQSSDWLWWYGEQQSGPDKQYFDSSFRTLLAQVYTSVGAPVPDDIGVSLVPSVVITGERATQSAITPTINGTADEGEWNAAGVVNQIAPTPPGTDSAIDALYYGTNADSLFLRIDAHDDWSALASDGDSLQDLRVGVYFAKPGATDFSQFSRLGGDGEIRTALGMSATHVLEWSLDSDGSAVTALYAANGTGGWTGTSIVLANGMALGKVLELSAPLQAIGGLNNGDHVTMMVVISRNGHKIGSFPTNGLAQLIVPDIGQAAAALIPPLGSFDDPLGDDHGPGTYTYPTDAVFVEGVYDLKHVTIAFDNQQLTLMIELNSPIDNVWSSPIGLSVQTFDIYIDKDPGTGSGERNLLEGRNAALPTGNGWEAALWIEGWNQQLFLANAQGEVTAQPEGQIKVEVDPAGTATIALPIDVLGGGDPATWGYAIAVLSQEAFPSDGVLRVRDIDPSATQWHFGGAPEDTNHTRIIDALIPANAPVSQEAGLSQYPPSKEPITGSISPDNVGMVPLVTIAK
ncbi:MAG: hypothetical protein M1546_13185 [Chloroflexi bacterium]|nr:hypothetical protein [Chloroflexota bacterium]